MKIVIDIPKEMYENALNDRLCGSEIVVNAIKNGTPLPKGHGRLIDANEVTAYNNLYEVPTIIEADKE